MLDGVCAVAAFPGLVVTLFLIASTIEDHRLITGARSADFGREVEAYYLRPEARPPLADLTRRYGSAPVQRLIVETDMMVVAVPAEDAVFSAGVARAAKLRVEGRRAGEPSPGVEWLLMLGCVVAVLLFLRATQRLASWAVCRGPASRAARREYFGQVRRGGAGPIALGLVLTLTLASLGVAVRLTPEHEAAGVGGLVMVPEAVALVYLGGVLMRVAVFAVDVGMLAWGVNPHRSLWPDTAALAFVLPALALEYQSTPLTLFARAVAALAGGLAVKARIARRLASPTRDDEDEYRRELAGGGS